MRVFLDPRSVVLIGVPRLTGPGSFNNFEVMLRYGYNGEIYLVHPNVREIAGKRTYPTVLDLPQTPELAIISVGRDRVLPVLDQCTRKGIGHVVVISQGFGDADDEGKRLQRHIVDTARKNGVRVMGPNTIGVVNPFSGFSSSFMDIPRDPQPPPLSVVSQSGLLQVGAEAFTGPFGKGIDLGNTCDVDFVDMLSYLEDDPQTEVIVLHMEGLRRGRAFLETAGRVARKKPVIVLKTGRSEAGARAALSHSGSLVGADAVFEKAFQQAGLVRVYGTGELRAVVRTFLRFRPMQGPRVAAVTATGAGGILFADACEEHGLEMAPLSPSMRDRLENPRIGWHHLQNPTDLWPLGMVEGSFTGIFKTAVELLLRDDAVDAVLGMGPVMRSPLHTDLDLVPAIQEVLKENPGHKPVALWIYGDGAPLQEAALEKERGVACYQSLEEAIMGLSALWRYTCFLRRR